MSKFKMPTGKMVPPEKGPKNFKPSRDHFQPMIDDSSPSEKFKNKGYGSGHDMGKLGAGKKYKV